MKEELRSETKRREESGRKKPLKLTEMPSVSWKEEGGDERGVEKMSKL